MGGSSSKSSLYQEQNNTVINRSTLNFLNKQLNDTIVNTTIENVKSCSASIVQNNKATLQNLEIKGDFYMTINQAQSSALDFSCVQKSDVKNEIVSKLINQIKSQFENNIDTSILNQLSAEVKTKSDTDWGSMPWGSSDAETDTKQIVNNRVINDTDKNIENVIATRVEANYTQKANDSCAAKVINNNDATFKNITVGKDWHVSLDQEQAAKVYAQCVQDSQTSNKITEDILSFLDVKVKEDTNTQTDTKLDTIAETTAKKSGPLGFLGDLFGLSQGATMAISASAFLSVVCTCFIFLALIGYFVYASMKKD